MTSHSTETVTAFAPMAEEAVLRSDQGLLDSDPESEIALVPEIRRGCIRRRWHSDKPLENIDLIQSRPRALNLLRRFA
jgi:hypothetical protein